MAPAPEQIGPYRVLRPIATGGTAEVYEVQDVASGERLALKLLVGVGTSARRFNREYEAMTRLNHPSIVRVYHYGFHQGQPWLTMELLRGQPAQAYVKRAGKVGAEERTAEVLRIGFHVAKALHYIHDRKIVHRDLKSANVLVLPDERIKLLDFGAAAVLDAPDRITIDGEFVGTFAYASPEQLSGKQVDWRSDLYSLGVLLFRLLTGQRPFESDVIEDLVRMHLHETPPDPRTYAPGLDPTLSELVLKLLAKEPGDRPPTADFVAQRLEERNGRPFSTRSKIALHDPGSASRDPERRRLWEHLTTGPAATLVLIDGEEGSDRVRFVESAKVEAQERGWVAYTCLLKQGQSVGRLLEAFQKIADDSPAEAAAPTVAALRLAATPASLANPKDRAVLRQLGADVARLRTSDGSTVLLIVEEVHRADSVTLDLLAGLRRALHGEDVAFKLVVCGRSVELDGGTELSRRLADAFRVHLPALTQREVAVAVGNMLGRRPPPSDIARRLHEVSAGQPLYLEQAVQDMVDLRGIEADGNRLAWADQAMDIPPPERAEHTAVRMLAELPVVSRRVLEALAVADDATEPSVLAKTLGWSALELREVLERLVAQGFLRWRTGDVLRPEWRHPVLATLVAEEVHPCRRALLSRMLADAVRGLPPSRGAVRAMVTAGRTHEAARAAVVVAHAQLARSEVRSAVRVLSPVVDKTTDTDRGAEFAEILLLHAHCLRTISPTDPVNARSLARARTLAEALGQPLLLARTTLAQARLYAAIGHYANYRKALKAAWDTKPAHSPGLSAEIATELGSSYRLHGDLPKAEQWVDVGLAQSDQANDAPIRAAALIESGACLLARGRLADAEATLTKAIQLCERAGHRPGYWLALARWATVLRHQGRYSAALSELYARMPEASQSEDSMPYIEQLLATGWIELDLSRLGRAQECHEELAAIIHRGEHLHLRLEANLLHGRVLLASGQYRPAAYVLGEVQRGARQADLPVLAEHARALHAETLYALGDKEGSTTAFQSAVLGLLGSGDQTVLAEGCRGRARIQATERDPDEIFRPAQRLLDEQPMPLLKLERLLAKGAWHRAHGERDLARQSLQEAAAVLNRVATDLNDTDRAALRVHPWSTWIKRGLQR
ncbi:MAG: protein kinase [Myxococcota bacterium]